MQEVLLKDCTRGFSGKDELNVGKKTQDWSFRAGIHMVLGNFNRLQQGIYQDFFEFSVVKRTGCYRMLWEDLKIRGVSEGLQKCFKEIQGCTKCLREIERDKGVSFGEFWRSEVHKIGCIEEKSGIRWERGFFRALKEQTGFRRGFGDKKS